MEIGLNLYSIREQIKTEETFYSSMEKLKKMGISFVQYSGADFIPSRIAKVSKELDIPVVLTHVSMDRIISDTEKLMEEHNEFQCKNIGLGAMPLSILKDKNELYKTIDLLNQAGEKMKKNGYKFFYHNHHMEFFKYDGKTIFDYILENAPYINFTLDTYWVQYGGCDIEKTIKKAKNRIDCVHLKDYMIKVNNEGKMEPCFAPLGDGNLDFKNIVCEMKKSNVKYYLIEQDNATEFSCPFEQIARSVEYVKNNL